MSGFDGNDASFDGTSYECEVAHEVEEFVSCRFVGPCERSVVEVSEVCGILMFNAHGVGQCVESLLSQFVLVNDDGVVEVASLDEVGVE